MTPVTVTPLEVVGVDHIQLAIPAGREDDARAFYGALLGLREVPKPEAMRARGGVWFIAGPIGLHLGADPDMRPSAKAHPALVVADLDAWRDRLVGAGHEWRDDAEIPGVRRAHTRDPFGNRIELISAR